MKVLLIVLITLFVICLLAMVAIKLRIRYELKYKHCMDCMHRAVAPKEYPCVDCLKTMTKRNFTRRMNYND